MKLYLKAIKLHFKSLLQYRASFIISFISQILVFFSYYYIILALFTKFNNIKGFTLYEVLLCFSIIHFGFSMNEAFARGIDKFDELIKNGSLDKLLLKPKNILLLVLMEDFDFVKLSRVVQALVVMFIALFNLNVTITPFKILVLILMLIAATIIFFAIFLLAASYCFITIEGLEVRNVFTDGGKFMAQYPIAIFKKGFLIFFTFVIPYGFVNYYPLMYFLGKIDNIFYALSPLLVILYLVPCFFVFNVGMKKYTSVGC